MSGALSRLLCTSALNPSNFLLLHLCFTLNSFTQLPSVMLNMDFYVLILNEPSDLALEYFFRYLASYPMSIYLVPLFIHGLGLECHLWVSHLRCSVRSQVQTWFPEVWIEIHTITQNTFNILSLTVDFVLMQSLLSFTQITFYKLETPEPIWIFQKRKKIKRTDCSTQDL